MAFTAPTQDVLPTEGLTPSQPEVQSGGFTAPQSDMQSQGFVAPSSDQYTNPQASDGLWSALGYNLGMGTTDSVRGGAQILDLKEDEMKAQQDKLNANLDQYGAPAWAAYIGGLLIDPVAWAIPISRIKHLTNLSKLKDMGMAGKVANTAGAGAVGGGIAGGLSYVDEEQDSLIGEGKMTRGEQALYGVVGGGVIGGAATYGATKLANSGAGEKAWNTLAKPEVGLAVTGGALGGFAGYHSGINEQTEPLLGDMVSEEFVESGAYAKWRNALMGAAVGAGTGRVAGKQKPHWFVPDWGLDDGLVSAKARTRNAAKTTMKERIDPTAKKIDGTLKGLSTKENIKVDRVLKDKNGKTYARVDSISERDLISEIMYKTINEGPEVAQKLAGQAGVQEVMQKLIAKDPKLTQAMAQTTEEVNKVIKELGGELVDGGLLDKRVWQKNQDGYLHRNYNKAGQENKTIAEGGYGVIGDEFMVRGITKKGLTEEQFQKLLKDEPDAGWEKWADTEKGGKFTVRRDYDAAERMDMEENMDLLDAFMNTGRLMAHDLSAGNYMQELSKLKTVSSDVATKGIANPVKLNPNAPRSIDVRDTRASKSSTPPDVGEIKYNHDVKVPNERRYGNLKGRYVSKDTFDDLQSFNKNDKASKILNSDMVKKYTKLNSFWKATKTVMNPAVHFNNFMSNIMMYDFGVTNMGAKKWAYLAQSARDLTRDSTKMSKEAREAMDRGVFDTNLNMELAEGAGSSLLKQRGDGIEKVFESFGVNGTKAQNITNSAMDSTTKALRWAKGKTYDKMANAYAFEDNVFRLSMYKAEKKNLMDNGMIESMASDRAASKAREWFVDYSRQTPALQVMKNLPLPFFSYTYGIIPRLAETAVKHPVKIAKWSSIAYLLNEASAYGSKDTLENIKEEERVMGELNDMYSGVGVRNKIRLPDMLNPFSENGDSAYLDITRAIPGGMPFSANRGGVGQVSFLPESMQPGFGAIGGALYPMLGIDQFRGKEIPEGEKLEAFVRNFTPNLAIPGSGTYAGNKIDLATAGQGSRYKDENTVGTAWAAGFGAKVTPNSESKNRQRIRFKYDAKIETVESQIRRLKTKRREGMISDDKYDKQLETLKNKRQRIKRNRSKALNG